MRHRRVGTLLLALAGCTVVSESPPDIGTVDTFGGEFGLFCLSLSPSTIRLTGGPAAEDREPATVVLSVPLDCSQPTSIIDEITLDDPSGAFALGPWSPGDVSFGETREVTVRLIAAEPGTYEGQLLVKGTSFGAPETRAAQLFGEVSE